MRKIILVILAIYMLSVYLYHYTGERLSEPFHYEIVLTDKKVDLLDTVKIVDIFPSKDDENYFILSQNGGLYVVDMHALNVVKKL